MAQRFVTRLTPQGRSAIASILVGGQDVANAIEPLFTPASGQRLTSTVIDRVIFGYWNSASLQVTDRQPMTGAVEELVVCRKSDQEIEIHCHGGRAAWRAIVQSLEDLGFEQVDWQDYLFAIRKTIQAEAEIALNRAKTDKAAAHLLAQVNGALEAELMEIMALIRQDAESAANRIQALLQRARFGRHLTDPFHVVFAGAPNVGKSSLINCIAGYERSIVFDQPGTTRDVVRTEIAIDGFPVTLSDTAGLRQASDEQEVAGIDFAIDEIQQADLVVLVHDATLVQQVDNEFLESLLRHVDADKRMEVLSKVDLRPDLRQPSILATSATNLTGIGELVDRVSRQIEPATIKIGQPFPFTTRQVHLLESANQFLTEGMNDAGAQCLQQILSDR